MYGQNLVEMKLCFQKKLLVNNIMNSKNQLDIFLMLCMSNKFWYGNCWPNQTFMNNYFKVGKNLAQRIYSSSKSVFWSKNISVQNF